MLNHFSHAQLFATLWTLALQALPSMGFCRQDYWSGLPCPLRVGLPDPGIEPASLMSLALAGGFFTTSATWGAHMRWLLLLLLLQLSRFSCVQFCAWTAAHQAPPSLGFSRQEHWSGLPFPSPHMRLLLLLSRFSHVRLCATPIDGSPPGSPIPGIIQARTLEWVAISFSSA